MISLLNKAIGTLNDLVRIRGAGPRPKQRQRKSYRLPDQTNTTYFLNSPEDFSTVLMDPFSNNYLILFSIASACVLSCALDLRFRPGVESKEKEFCTSLQLTKFIDLWLKVSTPEMRQPPC